MISLALWSGPVSSWGVADIIVLVIILAACVGITVVALRYFGITIPQPIVYIFWIVAVAFVAILAVRFLFSL